MQNVKKLKSQKQTLEGGYQGFGGRGNEERLAEVYKLPVIR